MSVGGGVLIGGRYRLLDVIGQGGMGRVWRGLDETLRREVAVKELLLPPGVDGAERDLLVRRVLREARAGARLDHPGIVTVHDVVEHAGAPVIVMEYVRGRSLGAVLKADGPLPVARAAAIGGAVLQALRRAHDSGIVHRDLKPDNVLLTEDRVVITDFGIAHTADATTALTRTGAVLGTPAYMAPEQLLGRPAAPANDLWALGAMLYTAVEGQAPFAAETFSALCIAVATEEPRPPVRAGALAPLLGALLTKDPERRATAEEALAALEAAAGGGPAAAGPSPGAAAPAAVPAPRPGSAEPAPSATTAVRGPGPAARARLARFAGCFSLILLTGTLLPWNRLADLPHGLGPGGLAVIALVALGHALPRPRLRPTVVLPAVFAADVLLFHGLRLVLGWRQTGFGTLPWQVGVNMLVISVGAWLLWWKVPGGRRS
ncbi:serine/threonine-protein kinase [Streptomyces toxytricini]|uniref:non-specific serine/threonine protein kinase n=1 Tax=Streptomyces toxytricini TaxID=67369 RepID=A0ABW8EG29_STRT5